MASGRIQLFPQVPDMALYSVAFIAEGIFAPYLLVYLVISEDVSLVHHQQVKNVIFLYREVNFFASMVYLPAVRINLKSWY